MIRLDAISIVGRPQRNKADIPELSRMRVNGVLQSGLLSAHQELEVRFNGALLTGIREGDHLIFSWQWVQANDLVQLVLRSRGVPTKHWRASWDGHAAIIHTGTLPVQVVFDGNVQLPTEEARINGDHPMAAPEEERGAGMRTNLAVIAAAQPTEVVPQERGAIMPQEQSDAVKGETLIDAQKEQERQEEGDEKYPWEDEPESDEERWEDELEGDAGDDDGDRWEDEEDHEDQGEVDEVMDEATAEVNERELNVTTVGEDVHREIRPPADMFSTPTWQVTTVHVNSLAQEQTLQTLRELVALRPKTLIVDIRPGSPQKKRHHTQDQVSKQALRTVFGATYWDRGWAIVCSLQMVPRGGKIRGSSWRYVVHRPESRPDGIPALEQKLAEGYALVIIDSLALYGESRRRAVVEELLRRVPDLTLGPLG